MKKFLVLGFLLSQGLGIFAQSFVLDTTFQPFFDITKQRGALFYDIHENDLTGNIYLGGNFKSYYNQKPYEGLVSYKKNGAINFNFNFNNGGASIRNIIHPLSNEFFYVANIGNGNIIDSTGGFNYVYPDWRRNSLKTVKCRTGIPYFYHDGSSLSGNGGVNSGLPCPTIYNGDTLTRRHILKLTPEGLWDSTFSGDANFPPVGFAPYDSNRILIYGYPGRFTHYNGVRVNGLCRIFLDGTLDTTFTSPLQPIAFGSLARPNLVNADGSFFLLGFFYVNGHNNQITIAKLKANGELDSSFMNFSSPKDLVFNSGSVVTLAELPDKGYLVGGFFNDYQGYKLPSIAKIDSTGKVDPTYFVNSGPDSSDQDGVGFATVNFIYKSKFGGYYVGGDFRKWNGKSVQPIVRITDVVTSVREHGKLAEKVSLVVYPNPTKESISLKLATFINDATYEVQLREITGKLLISERVSYQEHSINLNQLAKGSYLMILIKDGAQVAQEMIIKQ